MTPVVALIDSPARQTAGGERQNIGRIDITEVARHIQRDNSRIGARLIRDRCRCRSIVRARDSRRYCCGARPAIAVADSVRDRCRTSFPGREIVERCAWTNV